MSAAAILTHSYRRHISLDDPQRSFIRFCNNNDAKWLYCKPITSYRQVCIDRTVSIWTNLSCCRYDAFSKVFIASLIASVNKSTLKETQALFARFVSRIEIKIKDYNEPNTIIKCLLNQGVPDIYKQKNKANKTTVRRKSNEICFLVFGV